MKKLKLPTMEKQSMASIRQTSSAQGDSKKDYNAAE